MFYLKFDLIIYRVKKKYVLFKIITKDGGFNFENFDFLHDIIIYLFSQLQTWELFNIKHQL
jgi:hypothetical protein